MVPLYKDGSYSACLSQVPPHMSFDLAQEVCMSGILVFGDYRLYYCSLIQSFEHPAGTGDRICLTT